MQSRRWMRNELKTWLKEKGETQATWAKRLKVHHMTVWSWINSRKVKPLPLVVDSIRKHSPDCPILKEVK